MPISGVVITSRPDHKREVLQGLATISEIEVHGDDTKGHIVAVLETASSEDMEKSSIGLTRIPMSCMSA